MLFLYYFTDKKRDWDLVQRTRLFLNWSKNILKESDRFLTVATLDNIIKSYSK